MKVMGWRGYFTLTLLALSVLVYYIHYLIFRDVSHIFLYLIGDIGFVFVQVLLVTLILQKIMEEREKRALMKKMNMVIGAFFSEAGTNVLKQFASLDPSVHEIRDNVLVCGNWSKKEFARARRQLNGYTYSFDAQNHDLDKLKAFLLEKRTFFLGLLENPNLLEHDSFTDLLWAVFHLTEELAARETFTDLPDADYDHLKVDMKRVYTALTRQWLNYMEHLCEDYPFLFSFAMRTNPFNPDATVSISR